MASDVTLRQIAKHSGLSLATVSLALRDSPKISAVNRAAIKALADQMGYRPNPLVTACVAKIRSARTIRYQSTLAWVNDHPDVDYWKKSPLWLGAKARAEQLGFSIDELYLPSISIEHPEQNVQRFCRVARARGIHGVILPELQRSHHAQEEWPDMAVVVVGEITGLLHQSTIAARRKTVCYHAVVQDYFGNIRLAYDELAARGYQRIGFTGTQFQNAVYNNTPRAAAMEFGLLLPKSRRIPPLFTPNLDAEGESAFAQWMETTKPDIVLTMNNHAGQWLRRLGFTPPGDVGLAHVSLGPLEAGWSGIDPHESAIGASAVDLLSAHLIRNERGTPPYAKRVSILGTWVDGTTTRSKTGHTPVGDSGTD